MTHTSVQKLAHILRVLVMIVFVCNLVALLLVPGMALMRSPEELVGLTPYENSLELPARIGIVFLFSWYWLWTVGLYEILLAVFLWICGVCTAVILWQAKRVLDNILAGVLFAESNADRLKRAAVCSFVIATVSLLWAVFRAMMNGVLELFSLSTLFFPVFFLVALLFFVMSALFRQAAELKAENDLTI